MTTSRERRGGASAEEAEMTWRSSGTPESTPSLLLRGDTMHVVAGCGVEQNTDGVHIRVCYLDEGMTQATWHHVPNASTLQQMLREQDQCCAISSSPPSTGDHFAKTPSPLPASTMTAANAASALPSDLAVDRAKDDSVLPAIRLSPTSPPSGDARPAWVSIKAATEEELEKVMASLPVHVLTRRRIISALCSHTGAESGEPSSDTEDKKPSSYEWHEKGSSSRHHMPVRENFLEYFPAHGYAVLCLQAMSLQGPESAERGIIERDGASLHATQLPCTPVVALAFESALFTFSAGDFGGEEDVQLIMADLTWSTESPSIIDAAGVRGNHSVASRSTSPVSTIGAHKRAECAKTATSDAIASGWEHHHGKDLLFDNASDSTKERSIEAATEAPLAHPAAGLPSRLSVQQLSDAQQPMTRFGSPYDPTSPGCRAATAISIVCSSLVSAIIASLQQSTRARLIEADQLDELVLQILPSRVDQDDMLVRTKSLRHRIAFVHIDALQKERVLKELLLPAMRLTPFSRSSHAVERYQRALSSIRSMALHLRKGRDIANRASMTLISGVSARLLSHCNFMDYLNHVQTQIAVILMPITIIPNLFAMNVRVPFTDAETTTPFYCIVGITLGILVFSVMPIVCKFLMYKTPGALAPLD
ncbi:hypothetical protein LSCM1_03222 [Leishmania martiniquensis]|uniref:Divalent cation transporter n=1 Tax=Leishmania martiniquensis TaxID=1580590 RepID=A0A836KFM0_9TRYP|nr:hypothetical protein LSCM1_03222 [Leishmania martiniquensis]